MSLVAFALAGSAAAYCRSTTCSGDCPRDENGCKTTGAPLFWASSCVGISLQADGTANQPMAEVRDVVDASLLAWTDTDCGGSPASMAFVALGDAACHAIEYNPDKPNANVILFQDTSWSYAGENNNLAKTTVTYNTKTGEILDADIEVNHAFNEITIGDAHVVYDLQSLLTHEVGHLVGLDHSPDPFATMFAGYEPETTEQRTLEFDDTDGLCAAYPPDREATCAPAPRNGFGSECGQSHGGCSVAPRSPVAPGPAGTIAGILAISIGLLRRRSRNERS